MVKLVTLFLIGMIIMGLFGKLRAPRLPKLRKPTLLGSATKCRHCGTPNPGKGPCPCGQSR